MQLRQNKVGFTLLEILIALFIFSILSLMLASALHHVINIQSGTETNATRLRQLQRTLLVMSRDIEQAIDRCIITATDKQERAFVGTPHEFSLTHIGFANPTGTVARSTLQRTRYLWKNGILTRQTWSAVDLAPASKSYFRELLTNTENIFFEYLDKDGYFHTQWPLQGQDKQAMPRAVRITITIPNWGSVMQLYVIPLQPMEQVAEKKTDDTR